MKFPNAYKFDKVIPIYKARTKSPGMSNFRPISYDLFECH